MRKELRLKRPSDFKKAFKEGKKVTSPHFVLYMRENSLSETRIGISISKIHLKLATRRNRLRRIAKEVFRKEIVPVVKGYDFVVTSKASCAGSDMREAIKELKDLIFKIKE